MPRPQRQLDPSDPVHAFAAELRKLREEAGNPKYLQMARATGRSRTSLAEAAGGDHLPTWDTVAAFVKACNGDEQQWRVRWEQVSETIAQQRAASPEPSFLYTEGPTIAAGPSWRQIAIASAITFVIAIPLTMLITRTLTRQRPETVASAVSTPGPVVARVQNMVALGADQLIEDSSPVFLSTVPLPYCTSRGCRMEGTNMWSGVYVVARCQIQGALMSNYNLDSSEVQSNPNKVSSSLWYLVVLQDGRSGFISEVYIDPAHRGGLGLPVCPTPTATASALPPI